MPAVYCNNGHRVTYAAAKPEKCPTCQCSMSALPMPPQVAPAAYTPPANPFQNPFAPQPGQQAQYQSPTRQPVGDFTFDRDIKVHGISMVNGEPKLPTVEDIRARGEAIERTDGGATNPSDGRKRTTAADLVREMVATAAAEAPVQVSAPVPAKRRSRKGSKSAGGAA